MPLQTIAATVIASPTFTTAFAPKTGLSGTLCAVGLAAVGSAPVGCSANPLATGTFVFMAGADLVADRKIRDGSLEVTEGLGGVKQMEYAHQELSGGVHLTIGRRVILRQETVDVFRGTIDRLEERKAAGDTALLMRVEAVDLNTVLERRLVTAAAAYTGQLAGAIAKDLISTYASGEGITTNSVQDGATVAQFSVEAFVTVAKALRDLSDLTGFIWFVDAMGDLHFESQTAVAAPFLVALVESGTIVLQAPDGGLWRVDVSDAGVLSTTSVSSGTASAPRFYANDGGVWLLQVTNAGVLQTASSSSSLPLYGWALVSSAGRDWLLRVNNSGALTTRDDRAVRPLEGVRVTESRERYRNRQTVRYSSDLSLSVTTSSTSEQGSRAAVEGGTGVYHSVEDATQVTTSDEAMVLACGLLRRFGAIPTTLEFSTRTRGLQAGQALTVSLQPHNACGIYLIDKVTIRDEGAETLRWDVTALSGEHLDDHMLFWRKALGKSG